jgi:hypothetical protein
MQFICPPTADHDIISHPQPQSHIIPHLIWFLIPPPKAICHKAAITNNPKSTFHNLHNQQQALNLEQQGQAHAVAQLAFEPQHHVPQFASFLQHTQSPHVQPAGQHSQALASSFFVFSILE